MINNKDIHFNYDKEADAAYLKFGQSAGKVKTDSFIIPDLLPFGDINFDFDEDGKIVGIEILNASKYFPKK